MRNTVCASEIFRPCCYCAIAQNAGRRRQIDLARNLQGIRSDWNSHMKYIPKSFDHVLIVRLCKMQTGEDNSILPETSQKSDPIEILMWNTICAIAQNADRRRQFDLARNLPEIRSDWNSHRKYIPKSFDHVFIVRLRKTQKPFDHVLIARSCKIQSGKDNLVSQIRSDWNSHRKYN
jgi:hypothetical protein